MPAQLKAGLVIVGSIVLLSLLAPWIAPHPWDTISIRTRFQPPSLTYWFGTDDYGRDVLSRLLMGGRLVLVGLGIGIAASIASARLLRSQLFGVEPADPLSYAVVAVVLAAVALVACYLPARRAAGVDPLVALREE